MRTWDDKEIFLKLVGTGFNRETVQVEEDSTYKTNSIFGSISFNIE